jgi:hypothetical protein
MTQKPQPINMRNFKVALNLAERAGVTTIMLTGKGEPTLWPERVEKYLKAIPGLFPFIEIQTNGLALHDYSDATLERWYALGITTIAISVAGFDEVLNRAIYTPGRKEYPPLKVLIDRLHRIGFSVRLNCIMTQAGIHDWESAKNFIGTAQGYGVEQTTLMPVNAPESAEGVGHVKKWIEKNRLMEAEIINIHGQLSHHGTSLMKLAHGAEVFDLWGQNVCLSNCLEKKTLEDDTVMRNLIFFPDGHLRYDWEHPGAILI